MRSQETVLCIQDGSRVRYATRPACVGLQVIGRNQTKTQTRGIHLRTLLATTTDGLPLGVLHRSYRDPSHSPLKPKAQRWLDGRKLGPTLAAAPAAGTVQIEIKRVTARPDASGKPARPGRSYRIADAAVRYCQVTQPSTIKGAGPVTMY